MKYVPQSFINGTCGYAGEIITEDIPSNKLTVLRNPTGMVQIKVSIECPVCHNRCDLTFEEKRRVGDESLFECVTSPNVGLKMWRRIKDDIAMQPVFQPNNINRTALEKSLDCQCYQIADHMVKWKNEPQPGQQLVDILKEVEDYTQQESWKKFTKRHYMVAMCAVNAQNSNFFKGFSGRFDTVNKKNVDLTNALQHELGGVVESESHLYCNNIIGHCAEVHAANCCMNGNNQASTDQLLFSISYQCRTARPRSYCMNCITLFDTVRNG